MRTTQCVRAGWVMGALGACMLVAGAARADVTTQRPGSILIFPKVVNDGTRDTVIQITNTSNSLDTARCFYLAGQLGANGLPLCSETDFFINLTRQQPTIWRASTGRGQFSSDGLSPGQVPPVPLGFTGALICAEVDSSLEAPVAKNALKGEATLLSATSDDQSKYNGIAFLGGAANDGDNVLNLDSSEYNACPAGSRVDFIASDAEDPVIDSLGNAGRCSLAGVLTATPCNTTANCTGGQICSTGQCSNGAACNVDADCTTGTCAPLTGVTTNVTVLPCNLDLNALVPTAVSLVLSGKDTEQSTLSGSKTMSCWESFAIDTSASCAGGYGRVCLTRPNTTFASVDITSGRGGPVIAVAEAFHTDSVGHTSTAAVNLHVEGQCVGACTAPSLGVPCLTSAVCGAGTCTGVTSIGSECNSNADCGGGLCSGPRFCSGGTDAGQACTADANCTGGTCPLPSARIHLPGA
ncbi:MAG: hypothetical protein ACHQ9S_16560 [Candidatus Binatia bacterium]